MKGMDRLVVLALLALGGLSYCLFPEQTTAVYLWVVHFISDLLLGALRDATESIPDRAE